MAEAWKTEYHLIPPNEREAVDWFDDRAEAIAAAIAKGDGWKVEEVTSYLDNRREIFTAGQASEGDED